MPCLSLRPLSSLSAGGPDRKRKPRPGSLAGRVLHPAGHLPLLLVSAAVAAVQVGHAHGHVAEVMADLDQPVVFGPPLEVVQLPPVVPHLVAEPVHEPVNPLLVSIPPLPAV